MVPQLSQPLPRPLPQPLLQARDALLVIDMQVDFLPGGRLGVDGGDTVVPGINRLARRFEHVILTQDWHPERHISFASTHPGKKPFTDTAEAHYGPQALWPEHCVGGSPGAEFAPGLDIPHAELILRKGFRPGIDSYSAFVENDKATLTGLGGYLRERGLKRLFFCGLAFDFCVGHSAVDAVRQGFEALIVEDLSRSVDQPGEDAAEGSVAAMKARLAAAGVVCIASTSITAAAEGGQ